MSFVESPRTAEDRFKLLRHDRSSAFRPVAGGVSLGREVKPWRRWGEGVTGAAANGFQVLDDFAPGDGDSYTVRSRTQATLFPLRGQLRHP